MMSKRRPERNASAIPAAGARGKQGIARLEHGGDALEAARQYAQTDAATIAVVKIIKSTRVFRELGIARLVDAPT